MRRWKLLIVDDEPLNIDYLEQELEDLGYETVAAYDGVQALEMVATENPDMILLDIMMPEMDGFQVLERLKENKQWRSIPVVVISAMSDIQSVVKGIEMGADDYLPKPFNDVLLRARLRSGLQKRAWQLQERAYLLEIEAEKHRADELLNVILPEAIAAELKANQVVQPREYLDVAVMFADIVGFTAYCDQHPAAEILANLQALIVGFEQIAIRYRLQKIKTIGDAFMAAGGLLVPLDNPVYECVQCGQEMISLAKKLPAGWDVRVGIHFGSVLGGVVGRQQYLFDIWGDTVNTAQRVERSGKERSVNLSSAAWKQVSDLFVADSSRALEIKGKGLLEIFSIRATS
jgi:DNA-binding response OmpR family regulator